MSWLSLSSNSGSVEVWKMWKSGNVSWLSLSSNSGNVEMSLGCLYVVLNSGRVEMCLGCLYRNVEMSLGCLYVVTLEVWKCVLVVFI